ncbi:MAG: Glu/Leu/Phe/Val dehydrogenase dimerization domain-containing protein [Nitrospirota bacterium]
MPDFEHSVPQLILEVSDEESGFLGYVVIDCILSGPAIGGVRMRDGLTLDEVAGLAREMTLKFAYLNIPRGGAKAGVIWRPSLSDEDRAMIFTAFGKNLGPILTKGIYGPGEDMGTSSMDIYHMKRGAGININRPTSNTGRSGFYTALTVFTSAEKLADSLGLKLSDMRVAVEGLGKVGMSVAELFSDAGIKIIGISTIKGGIYNPDGIDIRRLMELKKEAGDEALNLYPDAEAITKESLLALDADILIPCAGPYTITKENVSQIKAKMVVPGANLSATAEAESLMFERGIHYIPGFVSNCGGVLFYAVSAHGFWGGNVERVMKNGFGRNVSYLIESSRNKHISLSQRAKEIAESNLKRLKQMTGIEQKDRLQQLQTQRQKPEKSIDSILWRFYKLSLKVRASFLLRSFATTYTEDKISMEAIPWGDL